jgi:uncharacterized protein (TIGR00297 family)
MRDGSAHVDWTAERMPTAAQSRLKSSDWLALAATVALVAVMVARHEFTWLLPFAVTATFAVGGWWLRGVSASGAMAGGMLAFILYARAGWQMFAVLFVVFVLTLFATKVGRSRKQKLGVAEASQGRTAAQVTANLFVAAAALVLLPTLPGLAIAVSVLAEAAADTVSSEVGEAVGGQTYLITTLRQTAPGTNGGVSLMGTLAGIFAASAIAVTALLVIEPRQALTVTLAAVLGMLADSILGATLENSGYLNNDAVNLLGTATAAGTCYALMQLF